MGSVTMGEEMRLFGLQCPLQPEEILLLSEYSGAERKQGQVCDLSSPEPGSEQVFGDSPQHWRCIAC